MTENGQRRYAVDHEHDDERDDQHSHQVHINAADRADTLEVELV